MDYEDRFSKVMFQIRWRNPNDIMMINNIIADETHFDTMYIFDNTSEDTINEIFADYSPIKIMRMICAGSYKVEHKYARFNGYGALISSDNIADLAFDYELMTEFVMNHPNVAKSFKIRLYEDEEDEPKWDCEQPN